MDPRDITPLRGDRDAKLPSYTMSEAEGRVMEPSSGSVLFPSVVFWLIWGAGVPLTPGNTGEVAAAAMLTTAEVWLLGPCYNNSRSVEECGFVLQSVPTPPPFSPYVSPPLSQTGHFPNFSLFLTIASWGTHPASNPQAPRREGAPTVARYCADLSTAVIIKLSMAVIVSIVSASPPCVRSVES